MNNNDEFARDLAPGDSSLSRVAELGLSFIAMTEEVKELEEQLKQKKDRLLALGSMDIPEAMSAVGMTEFRLNNGFRLKTEPVFLVSLPKANAMAADNWLSENGHEGLMKRFIKIDMPKTLPRSQLNRIYEVLDDLGFPYSSERNIHPQTLGKWGREMNEMGEEVPEDIFNVYRTFKTTIVT